MKNKVLLIDPPANFPQGLNIGLGWLASNLKGVTSDVRVLGFANIACNMAQAEEILRKKIIFYNPDIIGFNIHCNTYHSVLAMIVTLRSYFKGMVVVGGPHAIYEKSSVLEKSPGTDMVVLGEGEFSFAQVCQRPWGEYEDIEGVIFRKGDQIVEKPLGAEKKEFPRIHYPDYRQFGIKEIYSPYPLSTSRGCPFSCSFCNPFMGGKFWRSRPMDDVFAEIEFAKKTFNIKRFAIVEPVFNLQPERVITFCEELIRRKISLPWYDTSGLRADSITADSIRAMKRAGCTHVKIGVESLVPEVFSHINKGETIEDIERAVRIIKAEKMTLYGSFIIGLPYDTLERTRFNYKLSQRLGFDFTEWSLLFPYPGTKAYKWMREHGAIYYSIETAHQVALDVGDEEEVRVACDTLEFTRQERVQAFWEINTCSGNYVISWNDRDWKKLVAIFKAIMKYDADRIFWHLSNLFRLFRMRRSYQGKRGFRFAFRGDAF